MGEFIIKRSLIHLLLTKIGEYYKISICQLLTQSEIELKT